MNSGTARTSSLDSIWFLVIAGVLIRLLFLPLLNLLPEEAYYWSYAQHLDIGYLDHPPMVAWLIYISESVLGRSEFAVRLPAFLGWLLFAYFIHRFTTRSVGETSGKTVLLLLAALPIYMTIGFIMTPDAPFYVFWAGCLYFLYRAIVDERRAAWYGAGICLGLGLLSKYTMGLILPATFIALLVDKRARRWFRRPEPYLAMIIGFILFSPVLYWNSHHDWMSFAFQGTRRWSGGSSFYLHVLIGSILILITPLGLYEAIKVLQEFWKKRRETHREDIEKYRKYLFMTVFALVPLSVFVVHSLRGQPKLNWTGPVWLAILPLIAARISRVGKQGHSSRLAKRWTVTVLVLLLFYAFGFSYLVTGMPGTTQKSGMKLPIAWKAYGNRLGEIESRVISQTGTTPIIIGLDKYWLASEGSFYFHYGPEASQHDATPPVIGGDGLLGGNGLMWNYWVPPDSVAGRNAILVSFKKDHLTKLRVTRHFSSLGDITREALMRGGNEIGFFFWRIGYDYQLVGQNP